MSFLNKEIERGTFGIIVGNRDVFPDHLANEGRTAITDVLKELNYDIVILNKEDTKFGVVETYDDAKKCAELFKKNKNRIIGILVILPNFGDEKP